MLRKGEVLGNYEILRKLGAGGFGVTYQARDLKLGHDVAIKEYFPEQHATREDGIIRPKPGQLEEFEHGRRDFLFEARRLARFKHPNIVGVSRFLKANNTAYIVMNFIPGRSLLEWLGEIEGEPPTQPEMDLLAEPLLSALELVHKNQMLHRDIKLSNIMISDDGRPVLIDFGAAREAAGVRSRDIGLFLSRPYTPLEMYSMETARQGPWSDIYSLAVAFYRCMTGVLPPDPTERVRDEVDLPMPSPSDGYRPQFLIGLEAALQVNWKKRPQSVAEWRESLFTATSLDRVKQINGHQQERRLEWIARYFRKVVGR